MRLSADEDYRDLRFDSEEAAQARADELTRLWEESDGDRGYRAYVARANVIGCGPDRWKVLPRPYMPGTCT